MVKYAFLSIFWIMFMTSCLTAQNPEDENSAKSDSSLINMRDTILYYYGKSGFQNQLSTIKMQLKRRHDTQDFWTNELLLLTDTLSNKLSVTDKDNHFQALSSSLDTSDYDQVSFIYLWLDYLNKQNLEPRYYSMLVETANRRQLKSRNLEMAYDYAVILSMKDKKRAFHVIDSCFQIYGDTLYIGWLRENLREEIEKK